MRAGFVLLFGILAAPLAAHNLAPELTGTWKGEAEISVDWCLQPTLPVWLHIAPDGRLTGRVGNAEISGGDINPRRGHGVGLYRVETEYEIRLNLEGPLVKAEEISRAWVELLVDLRQGKLVGRIQSSGSRSYPGASLKTKKEKMILRATGLVLTRVPEIT
jgi:hypothetical protein